MWLYFLILEDLITQQYTSSDCTVLLKLDFSSLAERRVLLIVTGEKEKRGRRGREGGGEGKRKGKKIRLIIEGEEYHKLLLYKLKMHNYFYFLFAWLDVFQLQSCIIKKKNKYKRAHHHPPG